MAYTGVSIVDYLKSVGKPSDFGSRTGLAKQYGITNYVGSAAQNTQLLNTLRRGVAPTPTPTPTPTPPPPSLPPPPGDVEKPPITTESDYGKVVLDAINRYLTSVGERQPLSTARETYKEQLGIPGMEETQRGITGQVTDVEGLLDNLESDINTRASRLGGVMTESQLRRRQAAEAKPLREQLTDLYRSQTTGQAGLTSARQELSELIRMEESKRGFERENILGLLPYYEKAISHETPTEIARREQEEYLRKEGATKEAGLGRYYESPEKATKATQTEITRNLKTQAFTMVRPELEKSRGTDGYVDPYVYQRLRADYAQIIGDSDEFDDIFASWLSPFERGRLGIGKVTGTKEKKKTDSNLDNLIDKYLGEK